MKGQLRFEAWTLPTSTEFKRTRFSIPAMPGAAGRKEISAWSDCALPVPDTWSGLDSITTAGTLIAVYDGDTWIDDFVAERTPRSLIQPSAVDISGLQVGGWGLSRIGIYPPDYPRNPSQRPNWIWDGENVAGPLELVDLGHINAVYELYLSGERYHLEIHATGGTFTLTTPHGTTAAINWNASGGAIKSALEALSGVNLVDVVTHNPGEHTIDFRNPKDLASNMTIATGSLTGGGATLTKESDGFDPSSNPTFTMTVTVGASSDTTEAKAWNVSPNQLEGVSATLHPPGSGLQGLTTVNDVVVSGAGVFSDPWVIVFHDPPVPTNVSVSFGAGSAFLTRTTEGRLDPSPVTQSMEADQRIDPIIHGLYDEPPIRVTTDAAHLDVGADWALQVSARGRFAGSQRIFSVIPGELYQAKIRLKPLVDGEYTLVFRDLAGNFIANTSPRHTPLTAGVYGDLIVADLRIPEGVNQVIMRAAVVDENPMTWQTHWTNWQHAELILGMPPANPGVIVGMLHADAEEREAGTWLNRTFSNTVDSDGTAWPNEYSYQADGFAMYLSDVVADMADLGYECTITRMATPSGGKTHDFNLFVPGGAGEDRSATGPTLMTGGAIVGGTVVDRLPAFTAAVAWGPEDLHSSSVDATTLANIGRLERFFDAEQHHAVESLDTFLAGQFSDEERNRKAAVARLRGGGSVVPGRDFDLGDTLVWQAPGRMVKNQRRAQVIAWRHGDPVADYEVHGSRVWDGQAAVWKAVERLIDAPKKRRRHHPQHPLVLGGGGGIPDVVIAAANTKIKKDADLVCTGQDDHLTFRRALDLLPDEGGWIHFLQGVYDWGEPVMLDGDGIEGLKVTGAGQGLSILRVADEAGMHSVFWTGGSVDAPDVLHVLTVEDLTIDGNKANATITGGLLTGAFGSENDVWLTRVELRNSSACGLGRADAPGRTSNRWFITDCNIHHNDTIGMVLDESLSNIKGTTTHNNGSHGMRALFGGTHRFTGSESRNNGGAGISGAGLTGTACFIVVGSDIRNNAGDGIAGPLISSIPSLIVANRIINNGGQSVNVWSTSVVEHNLIFGNGTDAPSPATGLSLQTVTFSIPGELTAGTGVQRWVASRSGSVLSARVAAGVGSGPVGDDLILDVNKNGSSVFEFIADQPVVEDGEEIGDSVAPTLNEDFVEGDWFTIDVDQVGSTDPGSHVTLMMEVGYL